MITSPNGQQQIYYLEEFRRLSPIYDNGTSLGHNLTEKGIVDHLKHDTKMSRYVSGPKTESHIRWNDQKLRHFNLLKNISNKEPGVIRQGLDQILNNFSKKDVADMLDSVDAGYDHSNPKFKLSQARKEFIYQLLLLRIEKLAQLRATLFSA